MKKFREKIERRVGQKLSLKPERCVGAKCAQTRRPNPPGVHGAKGGRRRLTQKGQKMLERKKLLATYLLESSALRRMVNHARARAQVRQPHNVAEQLMQLLERRLDNIVWRSGFAPSRSVARQIVSHGHIWVDGKRTDTPSRILQTGNIVSLRPESADKKIFEHLGRVLPKQNAPSWLALDPVRREVKVVGMPDIGIREGGFDVAAVIELYRS